jgi:hypothetical protein
MLLTREALASMDEAQLRREVLDPLFRAMGYKGVRETHGSTERGKDFIMWEENRLGEREYSSVVALATAITGRAQGSGSTAAKVAHQVRQSLGSTFPNALTLRSERITKCLVVTSKVVKAPARESLQDVLGDLWRNVHLIDGDDLWRLVEKHLKPSQFPIKLLELHASLSSMNERYNVVAEVRGDEARITVEPKNDAQATPLEFVPFFQFPETKEGRRSRAALRRHLRTGETVSIPGEFVSSVEVSEFLKPLLGAFPISEIVLDGSVENFVLSVDLVLTTPEGVRATLPYIELSVEHRGMQQITLSNRKQALPWKLKIVSSSKARRKGPKTSLTVMFEMQRTNVKQQLEMTRFQKALSRGGTLEVIKNDDGRVLLAAPVASGTYGSPADELLLALEELCQIQHHTGQLFSVPSSLALDDLARIHALADLVAGGEVRFPGATISLPTTRVLAQRLIKEVVPAKPLYFESTDEYFETVLGVTVSLGKRIIRVIGGVIPPEEMQRVVSELSDPAHQGPFDVIIETPVENEVVVYYPKYFKAEDRERFNALQSASAHSLL